MADKAIQKGYTKRYLPEKAWASLSKEERQETDQKKREGSRKGKQFVSNTEAAEKAGRAARAAKRHKEKNENKKTRLKKEKHPLQNEFLHKQKVISRFASVSFLQNSSEFESNKPHWINSSNRLFYQLLKSKIDH